MLTGFVGPAVGLSIGWSVLALSLGVCFGTFFMAFHANQGPRLGLPQMIQSRAQFGIRGALLPFLAALFIYIGFNVFNATVAADAIKTVAPGPHWLWFVAVIGVATAIGVVGHDLMHLVQRWLMPALILLYMIITAGALAQRSDIIAQAGAFNFSGFMVTFAAATGYQLSYSVYVSDYSRYLPEDISVRKIISWTYLGQASAGVWAMCLGALLGIAYGTADIIEALRLAGNQMLSGFGTFVVVASVPALVMIFCVNSYGAMLTGVSGVDAFRKLRPTFRTRVIGLLLASGASLGIGLLLPTEYLASFNTFLILALYFLIPWTAVNLVDFYLVRQGRYAVTQFYVDPGIYGRWQLRGVLAYLVGLVCMIPFVNLSFYTGPAAGFFEGADLSFVVGLGASAVAYYLAMRSMDLSHETSAIAESRRLLDEANAR